jgi:anti-sigma-K factor RskA
MIDERMEELASLHVLGLLTPPEARAFAANLARDPELQALVTSLFAARDALAGTAPAATPSPEVKHQLMAKLAARVKKPALRPTAKPAWSLPAFWLPWAVATAAVVICVHQTLDQRDLQSTVRNQNARITELDQLADTLRGATNQLSQTVANLQSATKLADVRIALLSSLLSDSPKAVAVSLWDNQQQSGVFVVQNLKPLPADRDYQLWVIDPQYAIPVSAGVFQVDNTGNVRLHFKTDKAILTADKFAVTLEPKGGLPTPTLKNLVLMGG